MLRFRKTNRSAYLNFLLSKYEAYRGATSVRSLPYHADIDPSDICQLRCPGCPTGIENEGRRQGLKEETVYRNQRAKLSRDLFHSVLDEIGEYLFMIEFHSQGEPLLNQDVTSFIRKAHSLGIETQTRTNLSLQLSDERIDDLASCGLGVLWASVDGFSQRAYEQYRVGGQIELVKRNLERLAESVERHRSGTTIVYQFLVFRWNEGEVEEARKFAEQLGIQFHLQDPIISKEDWLPSYRRSEKPLLSSEDVDALAKEWTAAGNPSYWKDHERHDYWIPAHPGLRWIPQNSPQDDSFCGWHYTATTIEPSGHLTPCCWTTKEGDRLGAIEPGRTSLADVWNGSAYQKTRAEFANPDAKTPPTTLCSRCYIPDIFKHVLSNNDVLVSNQFHEVFKDSEPALSRAFQLILQGIGKAERLRYMEYFEGHLKRYFGETGFQVATNSPR